MTTDLVPATSSAIAPEDMATGDAISAIRLLVETGDHMTLDEIRARAEAHALYERRAGSEERERHFALLRLAAEAALGVISFDYPEIIEVAGRRANWRALAAGLERGQLEAVCTNGSSSLSTSDVVNSLRYFGWTSVPSSALVGSGNRSVPWSEARQIARERGIAFESLPSDAAAVRARTARSDRWAKHMRGVYAAAERERAQRVAAAHRAATRKALSKYAPEGELAKVYGLLRQTIQAADRARAAADGPEAQEVLDDVLRWMYEAEDQIGGLVRERWPEVRNRRGAR